MRSPEELKAQAIDESGCCGACEYYRTTYDHPFGCAEAQAKTMIVQELVAYTEQLETRLAQVERERDALMHDVSKCRRCETCAKRRIPIYKCPHFDGGTQYPCWKWRGVCPENTKEG